MQWNSVCLIYWNDFCSLNWCTIFKSLTLSLMQTACRKWPDIHPPWSPVWTASAQSPVSIHPPCQHQHTQCTHLFLKFFTHWRPEWRLWKYFAAICHCYLRDRGRVYLIIFFWHHLWLCLEKQKPLHSIKTEVNLLTLSRLRETSSFSLLIVLWVKGSKSCRFTGEV